MQRTSTLKYTLVGFCGVAIGFIIGIASALYIVTRLPRDIKIEPILSKLRTGEITMGSKSQELFKIGIPANSFDMFDRENERLMAVYIYSYGDEQVTVYVEGDEVYAARYVDLKSDIDEKWFFCDLDRMSAYLTFRTRRRK